MKYAVAMACVALAAGTVQADASKQTYRDSMGRNQGTATTD